MPLAVFERLNQRLDEMESSLGEEAILLKSDLLVNQRVITEAQSQRFILIGSEQFSCLLWGEAQPETLTGYESLMRLYQVGLTFDPDAIANFLTHLKDSYLTSPSKFETSEDVLNLINRAQACLKPNNPAIQSEFTLSLIDILCDYNTDNYNTDVSPLVEPAYPYGSICQPVAEALHQQVEQERLLNQVTSQIRQSQELPLILTTAVERVRHFLEVDRLVIYQFDFPYTSSPTALEPAPVAATELGWGCITYEAKASDAIPSVLNVIEQEECLTHVPNCTHKYQRGSTVAVDDVDRTYNTHNCLLKLLHRHQVRAKLVAPIIVENNLWGLLIAHQCLKPRRWQDSEKNFLQAIAEHLAIAIYQAKLYAQVQQQNNTLEQRVIERTQALRDALQAAQAANLAKSEFLATMSHELRTPLTCVIGMAATLLRWCFGQDSSQRLPVEKQQRYLKTIQDNGQHLLELINDILDLSQVEAGKLVLTISKFSLSKLANQVLSSLNEQAYQQQVTLQLDWRVPPERDCFSADQRRVKQILFNLLSNGIKFTPEGGKVILRVWPENHLVVFQVEDTGIGIAEDQLPLLFQKFQQLETPYRRKYEGTGLGLALTKQLIELHRGKIEVESLVGEGSCFTVWLPTQPMAAVTSGKALPKSNLILKAQGTVTLVENQEEIATLICEILTAAGYKVIWLIDASTAIKQIALLKPQTIIIDWQLPTREGYEITQWLRQSSTTSEVKILALTIPSLPNIEQQEMMEVVDDYLYKPIKPMELLYRVMALVESYSAAL
ncbi:GAF domain-containing hybrid sensor histidine kinase/response regulator [Moorena sp. SIO3H5]|uniref:hybrid sensor histidine kinase/response regulator n=1 Tax=Moorena sp. SIO3H5 TaxID=2607834 RepID=UPI0013BD59DB|nr:GAF domain-containing hybrid sensor histidine kinase/response regulator [Moorena sp. SIO3H5]NEO68085.1 GAF domain-containing protein [Moorena sp. SIO3H5]